MKKNIIEKATELLAVKYGFNASEAKELLNPTDHYTKDILKEQFDIHKEYTLKRMKVKPLGVRMPNMPEDISENMIKFALCSKGSFTRWDCKGDLLSDTEGVQECKCFTSNGPSSFTPSSEWNVIYFLDARKWLQDHFILYKVNMKNTSKEWKELKMNKKESFQDKCNKGQRPRITWDELYPQISDKTQLVVEGSFEEIIG